MRWFAFVMLTVLASQVDAQESTDKRWAAIQRVLQQKGEAEDGYFKVEFPRTDVQVRIGSERLSTALDFTSHFGFVPVGANEVFVMGEVVTRDVEASAVLAEARRVGMSITGLHNHLVGETPRMLYMHFVARGAPAELATKIRGILAKTATPLQPKEETKADAKWSAGIDAVLGKHSEAKGDVVAYEFKRLESHAVHGVPVKSSGMLETRSEAGFQNLGNGRVASTGELYVTTSEVQPVLGALTQHGMQVTALHMHTLDERPDMYWIHWYTTGVGATLAHGVVAALQQMHSARRTE